MMIKQNHLPQNMMTDITKIIKLHIIVKPISSLFSFIMKSFFSLPT